MAPLGFSAVSGHDPEAENEEKMCPSTAVVAILLMILPQPDGALCKRHKVLPSLDSADLGTMQWWQ